MLIVIAEWRMIESSQFYNSVITNIGVYFKECWCLWPILKLHVFKVFCKSNWGWNFFNFFLFSFKHIIIVRIFFLYLQQSSRSTSLPSGSPFLLFIFHFSQLWLGLYNRYHIFCSFLLYFFLWYLQFLSRFYRRLKWCLHFVLSFGAIWFTACLTWHEKVSYILHE